MSYFSVNEFSRHVQAIQRRIGNKRILADIVIELLIRDRPEDMKTRRHQDWLIDLIKSCTLDGRHLDADGLGMFLKKLPAFQQMTSYFKDLNIDGTTQTTPRSAAT